MSFPMEPVGASSGTRARDAVCSYRRNARARTRPGGLCHLDAFEQGLLDDVLQIVERTGVSRPSLSLSISLAGNKVGWSRFNGRKGKTRKPMPDKKFESTGITLAGTPI